MRPSSPQCELDNFTGSSKGLQIIGLEAFYALVLLLAADPRWRRELLPEVEAEQRRVGGGPQPEGGGGEAGLARCSLAGCGQAGQASEAAAGLIGSGSRRRREERGSASSAT